MLLKFSGFAGYAALVGFTWMKWSTGADKTFALVIACVLAPCLYTVIDDIFSRRRGDSRTIVDEILLVICWLVIGGLSSVAVVIAFVESCNSRPH
ncbi:MAG: hypothetical protein NT069_05890 [Planctomycetota bacterium]|nr:hypothetical protein [Planctomycetota bacterium]